MTDKVGHWIALYRRAWESNDPDDIRALFARDAEYRTEPYADPWVGHEQIVDGWLEAADDPGETEFEWSTLIASEKLTVIEAQTTYAGGPTYSNMWVVVFADDGRALKFTEWWMDQAAHV